MTLPKDPSHPQYHLRTFYLGSYILLGIEAIVVAIWIVQMFVFKFAMDRMQGTQYRLVNVVMIFHFGTPIALSGIVQQTRNNNSVFWWTFFAFLMGLAGDLETVLELSIQYVTQDVLWAWRFALALGIINLTLTCFSIVWYLVWVRRLPTPVAFRKLNSLLLRF